VISFFFGAKTSKEAKVKTRKELVLLFDEDLSRLHMTIDDDSDDDDNGMVYIDSFPKEENIIKLWKLAAQNIRKQVKYKGIKCIIHLDPTLIFASSSADRSRSSEDGSTAMHSNNIESIDTKRDLLDYIQRHCHMDFLREQKINSRPEVVLRKTNKKALLKIWNTWTKKLQASSVTSDEKGKSQNDKSTSRQLKAIYKDLLRFSQETSSASKTFVPKPKSDKKVIAGTLHESSEEFPCFGFGQDKVTEETLSLTSYDVCLFLGAVRDMTPDEHDLLKQVCEASKTPLVGFRFGTLPEFTSKILSLLAFHHAHQVFDISIKRLLNQKDDLAHHSRGIECKQEPTRLTIICTVPKSSKEISIQMEQRDHIHWRLVRVIVCSLWRSKLVSSNTYVSHSNMLHLVFDDGVVVTLTEREFVGKLANRHQAAPSEFQILSALVQEISHQSKSQMPPPPSSKRSRNESECGGWSRKKLAKRLVKSVTKASPIPITCTVGIESNATNELTSRFYHHSGSENAKKETNAEANKSLDRGLLIVIDILSPPEFSKLSKVTGQANGDNRQQPREIYRQLLSASTKLQIPTMKQTILPKNTDWCWDREAASIIAVQHMCHQNRVFARQCYHPHIEGNLQRPEKKRKRIIN